jgi:protein-tyrosine phosphatase
MPEIYLVADALLGALFIMPCPKGDMSVTVADWQARGIDCVVSMLPQVEAEALGVGDEAQVCARAGIRFVTHPISDFGLPDPAAFDPFVRALAKDLQVGRNIAVHCRAGIGRSGMAVACTLIALGQTVEDAVINVTQGRGVSIPDTVEQHHFITSFAKR